MEVPELDNYYPSECINQSSKIRESCSGRFFIYFIYHPFVFHQPTYLPVFHPFVILLSGTIYTILQGCKSGKQIQILARIGYYSNFNYEILPIVDEMYPTGLERLTANAEVATVLDSIPASSDTVEFELRAVLPTLSKIIRPDWPKYSAADKKVRLCVKLTFFLSFYQN
jgi:hypothetical protein